MEGCEEEAVELIVLFAFLERNRVTAHSMGSRELGLKP